MSSFWHSSAQNEPRRNSQKQTKTNQTKQTEKKTNKKQQTPADSPCPHWDTPRNSCVHIKRQRCWLQELLTWDNREQVRANSRIWIECTDLRQTVQGQSTTACQSIGEYIPRGRGTNPSLERNVPNTKPYSSHFKCAHTYRQYLLSTSTLQSGHKTQERLWPPMLPELPCDNPKPLNHPLPQHQEQHTCSPRLDMPQPPVSTPLKR